jgi:flavin reductase (DIM6/NTAB) family NADH-FMN oxidoreductase RutF
MDDRTSYSCGWRPKCSLNMFNTFFDQSQLETLEKKYRTALINSASGIRTAFLGVTGADGIWNSGTFSNVTHVGSHPAQISVLFRPDQGKRHTLSNYRSSKLLTLTAIPLHQAEILHDSSVNAPYGTFEWSAVGGSVNTLKQWTHPIPTSALWAMELEFIEEFELNNGCVYTVGSIKQIGFSKEVTVEDSGRLSWQNGPSLALGLNQYTTGNEFDFFPYPNASKFNF